MLKFLFSIIPVHYTIHKHENIVRISYTAPCTWPTLKFCNSVQNFGNQKRQNKKEKKKKNSKRKN